MMQFRRFIPAFILVVFLPALVCADIVLQAPVDGEAISTMKPELKAFLQMPQGKRREYFNDPTNRNGLNRARDASPYEFKWVCTAGESGTFSVVISEEKNFSEPSPALTLSQGPIKKENAEASVSQGAYEAGIVNFLIGKTYYWKVVCKTSGGHEIVSHTKTFRTDSFPPRLLDIPKVGNVRDLGGRTGLNGKMIRQGMIFRSAGLNNDSPDFDWDRKKWKKQRTEDFTVGTSRLTPAGVAYIDDVLQWKTEMDLRGPGEVASMNQSPAGSKVKWINHSSAAYAQIFGEKGNCLGGGPRAMAEDFRLFCDPANYPIDFHCIAGADRTGAMAYVLDGVLGVDKDELEKDWEITANGYFGYDHMFDDLASRFDRFGEPQDPVYKEIEAYLHKIGITDAEIARYRSIMLEK